MTETSTIRTTYGLMTDATFGLWAEPESAQAVTFALLACVLAFRAELGVKYLNRAVAAGIVFG